MSGQCPFWELLLAWKFVLLRVYPEFPCERPLGLLRDDGGFRVGASGPGVDSCDEQDGKRRQRLCMRCILVCRLEYIHATLPGVGGRGRSPLIRLRRLHTSGLPYERPRATRALW